MSTTPNKDNLVARLLQQSVAVGVSRKALNENTARAQAALNDTEQNLGVCISVLASAPCEIEAEEARIAKIEEQRAIVLTKQIGLEQQIADAPDWRLMRRAASATRSASGSRRWRCSFKTSVRARCSSRRVRPMRASKI